LAPRARDGFGIRVWSRDGWRCSQVSWSFSRGLLRFFTDSDVAAGDQLFNSCASETCPNPSGRPPRTAAACCRAGLATRARCITLHLGRAARSLHLRTSTAAS
jgi:hypothetical protein